MLSVPLLLVLGVILVPMIKRSAVNHPAPQKPEQITEEVSVPVIELIPAEAPDENSQVSVEHKEFLPSELTEVADTAVTVTGQKGNFTFESVSSSNQMPAVIPEAQIRELIQVQQRMAEAQK
jgi:cytoskeletal protein RodZ